MKILLAVNSDIKHGSVGIRTGFVKEEAMRRGWNVKVVTRSNYPLLKAEALIRNYLRYSFFPTKSPIKKLNEKFDKKVEHLITEGIKVFHTWDILPLSLQKARDYGITTIVDIQMAPVGAYYNNPNVDYFIAPSEYAKKTCTDIGIPPEKIIVNPFGVSIQNFKQPNVKVKNMFKLLFVGCIDERKGITNLLQAWTEANIIGGRLILCGKTHKNAKSALKEHKNNFTISNIGFQKEKNLLHQYQQASGMILPSREEGSAKVTYEALACGCPVICTENAGSVVDDWVDGFICDNSVESIKENILSLYELWRRNYKEYLEMCKNARKKAEMFTWQDYGRRVCLIQEKVRHTP